MMKEAATDLADRGRMSCPHSLHPTFTVTCNSSHENHISADVEKLRYEKWPQKADFDRMHKASIHETLAARAMLATARAPKAKLLAVVALVSEAPVDDVPFLQEGTGFHDSVDVLSLSALPALCPIFKHFTALGTASVNFVAAFESEQTIFVEVTSQVKPVAGVTLQAHVFLVDEHSTVVPSVQVKPMPVGTFISHAHIA